MQSHQVVVFIQKVVLVLCGNKRDLHFVCVSVCWRTFLFWGINVYTKEQLINTNLHDLRRIGKAIGVKAPSTLKKKQLISQILGIQKGTIAPIFSTFGRPTLGSNNIKKKKEVSNIEKEIDILLSQLKTRIINLINTK